MVDLSANAPALRGCSALQDIREVRNPTGKKLRQPPSKMILLAPLLSLFCQAAFSLHLEVKTPASLQNEISGTIYGKENPSCSFSVENESAQQLSVTRLDNFLHHFRTGKFRSDNVTISCKYKNDSKTGRPSLSPVPERPKLFVSKTKSGKWFVRADFNGRLDTEVFNIHFLRNGLIGHVCYQIEGAKLCWKSLAEYLVYHMRDVELQSTYERYAGVFQHEEKITNLKIEPKQGRAFLRTPVDITVRISSGSNVSLKWKFGRNGLYKQLCRGVVRTVTLRHTFARLGTSIVKVTASNTINVISVSTALNVQYPEESIHVEVLPPVARPLEAVTFTISVDEQVFGRAEMSLFFSVGDGTPVRVLRKSTDELIIVRHAYKRQGRYTVRIKAVVKKGAPDTEGDFQRLASDAEACREVSVENVIRNLLLTVTNYRVFKRKDSFLAVHCVESCPIFIGISCELNFGKLKSVRVTGNVNSRESITRVYRNATFGSASLRANCSNRVSHLILKAKMLKVEDCLLHGKFFSDFYESWPPRELPRSSLLPRPRMNIQDVCGALKLSRLRSLMKIFPNGRLENVEGPPLSEETFLPPKNVLISENLRRQLKTASERESQNHAEDLLFYSRMADGGTGSDAKMSSRNQHRRNRKAARISDFPSEISRISRRIHNLRRVRRSISRKRKRKRSNKTSCNNSKSKKKMPSSSSGCNGGGHSKPDKAGSSEEGGEASPPGVQATVTSSGKEEASSRGRTESDLNGKDESKNSVPAATPSIGEVSPAEKGEIFLSSADRNIISSVSPWTSPTTAFKAAVSGEHSTTQELTRLPDGSDGFPDLDALLESMNSSPPKDSGQLSELSSRMDSLSASGKIFREPHTVSTASTIIGKLVTSLKQVAGDEEWSNTLMEATSGILSSVGFLAKALALQPQVFPGMEITEENAGQVVRKWRSYGLNPEPKSEEQMVFDALRSYEGARLDNVRKNNLTVAVSVDLETAISTIGSVYGRAAFSGEVWEHDTANGIHISILKDMTSAEKDHGIGVTIEGMQSNISGNQTVTLQVTSLPDNPFHGQNETRSSLINSHVKLIDLDSEAELDGEVRVTVIFEPAAERKLVEASPNESGGVPCHRFEYRSTEEHACLQLDGVAENVGFEIYLGEHDCPTDQVFDYRTALATGNQTDGVYTLCIPPGILRRSGTVYLVLKLFHIESAGSRSRRSASGANDSSGAAAGGSGPPTFGLGLMTGSCLSWGSEERAWSNNHCRVTPSMSCQCENTPRKTFASTFYVPPNSINFRTIFNKFDIVNNASVFSTVIIFWVVFILCAIWARWQDNMDVVRWGVTELLDNRQDHGYLYLLTVFTGLRWGSGTRSRVSFVLTSEDHSSGTRALQDGIRKDLSCGSVTNFLMAVPSCLGDLQFLKVWHDNSGKGSQGSWYLSKIVVTDVQTRQRYVFLCKSWLAIEEKDGALDCVLPVCPKPSLDTFANRFADHVCETVTEEHMWLSILLRPKKSTFTRLQRLSCCVCLLFLNMVTNAMFYRPSDDAQDSNGIFVGPVRFTLSQLFVATVSIASTTLLMAAVVVLFKKSKPKQIGSRSSSGLSSLDTVASSARKPGVTLHYRFVYVGWAVVLAVILGSGFFLILYSMEWGKTKSEEWLTTFLLSFVESLFVADPVKVLAVSLAVTIMFKKSAYTEPSDSLDKRQLLFEAEVRKSVTNPGILLNWFVCFLRYFIFYVVRVPTGSQPSAKTSSETAPFPGSPNAGLTVRHLTDLRQSTTSEPLSRDVQEVVRRERQCVLFANKVLRDSLFYLCFLWVTCSIAFSFHHSNSFKMHEHLYNTFAHPPHNGSKFKEDRFFRRMEQRGLLLKQPPHQRHGGIASSRNTSHSNGTPTHIWDNLDQSGIQNLNDSASDGIQALVDASAVAKYIGWLNSTVVDAFFAESKYNGESLDYRLRQFTVDLSNFRLGPARLRQVRSDAPERRSFTNTPLSEYIRKDAGWSEDSRDYCLGWKPSACSPEEERAYSYTFAAWRYTPADKLGGLPTLGEHAVYDGGGYAVNLGVNETVFRRALGELSRHGWIDGRTGAVFLEFSLYNAHLNVIAYAAFLTEMPDTGQLLHTSRVYTFDALRYGAEHGGYTILCEAVFAICVLKLAFGALLALVNGGKEILREFFRVMEFLNLALSSAAVVVYVLNAVLKTRTMSELERNPGKFVSFQRLALWSETLAILAGFLIFLEVLQFIKVFGFNSNVYSIANTVKRSRRELFGCVMTLSGLYLIYALLGYLLFGRSLEPFRSASSSLTAVYRCMYSSREYDGLSRLPLSLFHLYFFAFVFFAVFFALWTVEAMMKRSVTMARRQKVKGQDMPSVLLKIIDEVFRKKAGE